MRITPIPSIWTRSEPSNTILTLEEIKEVCYIDTVITDDDAMLMRMEKSARNICERYLGRPLLTATQTLYYTYTDICALIDNETNPTLLLPGGTLQSIDKVSAWDADSVETELDASTYYESSVVGEQGQVLFKESPFPDNVSGYRELNALSINTTGGFGDTAVDVPDEIKQGMEFLIAYWYEHREDQSEGSIPSSAKAMWSPYLIQRFK